MRKPKWNPHDVESIRRQYQVPLKPHAPIEYQGRRGQVVGTDGRTHEQKANDAAHISSNSPDVVCATIDELLRLREENGRLKEGLENALHVNELRLAEVAKTLFTGIVEGISGDSESVRVQTGATCVHCNACFTSAEDAIAHDKVCPKHPANIRAELLEKEAEWLANRLACIQSEYDIEPETRYRSSEWWRETARKAVEEA